MGEGFRIILQYAQILSLIFTISGDKCIFTERSFITAKEV